MKDYLLKELSKLPDTRILDIYTLQSTPIRDQDIFLYAPQRPKAHVRQILVLLAQSPRGTPTEPVFVCAIEAYLYAIPSTSSSILYISKVDSSGQGGIRPNPTRALVSAFIKYYTSPGTRPSLNVWVHVFARAQNQYLFPNSADYPGKRVLRDIELCKWWKEVIEDVARENNPNWVRLYYLLPGYSSLEATTMLHSRKAPNTQPAFPWTYSHPYHQTDAPLASGGQFDDTELSIARLIPSFPDDPKARFLDDIASTPSEASESVPVPPTSPRKPRPKRPRTSAEDESSNKSASLSSNTISHRKGKSINVTPAAYRALAAVSPEEFWERMAFRQECVQGAVTGFFTGVFTSEVSSASLTSTAGTTASYEPALPPSPPGEQSHFVLERIMSTLMNLDFRSTERARRATNIIEDSIRALCKGGDPSRLVNTVTKLGTDPPSAAPPTEDAPSVIDEMAEIGGPALNDVFADVYGRVTVDNPPLAELQGSNSHGAGASSFSDAPAVTILQVRKKKRPAPTT